MKEYRLICNNINIAFINKMIHHTHRLYHVKYQYPLAVGVLLNEI